MHLFLVASLLLLVRHLLLVAMHLFLVASLLLLVRHLLLVAWHLLLLASCYYESGWFLCFWRKRLREDARLARPFTCFDLISILLRVCFTFCIYMIYMSTQVVFFALSFAPGAKGL